MEGTNIYFIGSLESGTVKIGKSNNPEKRLAELQIGNPHKLVLYCVITNVSQELENRLHQLFGDLHINGEWFRMTDELIHFMVNKREEASYDYKVNHPQTRHDPLDEAINEIVKKGKCVCESYLIEVIGKYLKFIGESSNFDVKKLIRKLEHKGIYRIKRGGQWVYPDYCVDEKALNPAHYLGPISILKEDAIKSWDTEQLLELMCDSKIWKNIKVSQGYSHITSLKDGHLTISTITTTAPGIKQDVVIYKRGVYDASNIG